MGCVGSKKKSKGKAYEKAVKPKRVEIEVTDDSDGCECHSIDDIHMSDFKLELHIMTSDDNHNMQIDNSINNKVINTENDNGKVTNDVADHKESLLKADPPMDAHVDINNTPQKGTDKYTDANLSEVPSMVVPRQDGTSLKEVSSMASYVDVNNTQERTVKDDDANLSGVPSMIVPRQDDEIWEAKDAPHVKDENNKITYSVYVDTHDDDDGDDDDDDDNWADAMEEAYVTMMKSSRSDLHLLGTREDDEKNYNEEKAVVAKPVEKQNVINEVIVRNKGGKEKDIKEVILTS